MSQEESQEDLFNRLLNYIEKSPETFLIYFFTAIKAPDSLSCNIPNLAETKGDRNLENTTQMHEKNGNTNLEERQNDIRKAFIKVMSSRIFYKNGLKGRQLTNNSLNYKVYFFNDLAFFILMATDHLTNIELDERLRIVISRKFDSAIKNIDDLKSIAFICCLKVSENKLDKLINNLEHIKSSILAKPTIGLPTSLRKTKDRVDLLIRLFQEQLPPDTPDSLISESISILLKRFDIFFEPEAIRQRIARAKRK
jgi:hypothetical protein